MMNTPILENNETLSTEKKEWRTPHIEILAVKHTQGGVTSNDPESLNGIWS